MTRSILILAALATLVVSGCQKKPPEVAPKAEMATASDPKPVPPEVVTALAQNFSRVHFEFDSARLDSASRSALDNNAEILAANPRVKVEVQGHADERGTTDYNLALGDRRANAVRSYLMLGGVSGNRLTAVSLGEERPLESGKSETAWSKNRRAEFRITVADAAGVAGTTDK